MGSATYTAILPLVRQRKNQYWGYAQDEWKVTANLTVTAGIRYNFFNALHALNNDDVPFDFGTCGGYCPSTYSFFHPRYDDFDPRLGIAWAHGDTVLRAGAGIYHTDGQVDDQNLPINNTVERYTFSNTAFPALAYPLTPFLVYAEAGGLGVVTPRDLDRNRKDDYVASWTASIQRKLPFNILGNRKLSRKQRNRCSDHHLRQSRESTDGRCALPGIRSDYMAWRRWQQHLPCVAAQRPPSLSERSPVHGELHVVPFHQ